MTQNETPQQLTVKEALEQGYESYFYNSEGWQRMRYIGDIEKDPDSIDWKRDDIFIVEKTPRQAIFMSEGELKDLIVDHFEGQYHDVTSSDDYNTVTDAFSDMDFKPFEIAIEKILEELSTYHSTDIKLVP